MRNHRARVVPSPAKAGGTTSPKITPQKHSTARGDRRLRSRPESLPRSGLHGGFPCLEIVVADLGKLLGVDEMVRMVRIMAFETDLFGHEPADVGSPGGFPRL